MDVTASTLTVISSAWTLAINVKHLIAHIKRHEENVQELEHKAETLTAIVEEVYHAYPEKGGQDQIHQIVGKVVARLEHDLDRFKKELSKLLDERETGRLGPGRLLKTWREQFAAPTFARLEKSMGNHQDSLQFLVSILLGRRFDAALAELRESNERTVAVFQALAPLTPLRRGYCDETLVAGTKSKDLEYEAATAARDPAILQQLASQFFTTLCAQLAAERRLRTQPDPPQNLSDYKVGRSISHTGNSSALDPKATILQGEGLYGNRQIDRRPSSPGSRPTRSDNPLTPTKSWPSDTSQNSKMSRPDMSQSSKTLFSRPRNARSQSSASPKSPLTRNGLRRSLSNGQENVHAIVRTTPNTQSEQRAKGVELLRVVQEASEDQTDTLELILKSNASLEEKDNRERPPLLAAAVLDKPHIVAMLLTYKADVRATDNCRKTALHLACEKASVDVISSLLGSNDEGDRAGRFPEIDVNATDKIGRTALHYCAQRDMVDAARLIVKCNADINVEDRGGYSPVYFAIKERNYATVELLLERKALVDAKCHGLETSSEIRNLLEEYSGQ